jgi:hypothetical protein
MKTLLLALLILPLAYAQQLQPVTSQQADCGKFIPAITTAGTFTSATVTNTQAACDGWVVTYSSFGFATVSVLLQDAPLTTNGAAGTFVSFAGTIVTGFTNPSTATPQGEIRATGYFPYVRVQITTTGTGYLTAEFHGFKTNPNSGVGASGGGGGGGCTAPCVVIGPTAAGSPPTTAPVLVAGQDGAPGNIRVILTDSSGRQIMNVAQWGGTTVLNGGTAGSVAVGGLGTAGTPSGGVVSVQGVAGGTAQPVTLPANQSVNVAQVAGTNTITGGVAGSLGIGGLAAAGAAIAGNSVRIGGVDGGGTKRDILTDTAGRVIVASNAGSIVSIIGTLLNNAVSATTTNNLGVLPAVANAAPQTWTEGDQVLGSVDLKGNLRTTIAGNATVLSGQQAVTNAAVALATNTVKNICVKALAGNTQNVYVGPTGITTSTGMELAAGDAYCSPVTNTNLIFVIAAAGGQSVSWIAEN